MAKLGPTTAAGITVGALLDQLRGYPRDMELFFGGLRFNRLKHRGDRLLQLEFHEQVYRTSDGELIAEDIE